MKNQFLLLFLMLISTNLIYSQQPATNNSPAGVAGGINNQMFWSRGGNTNALGLNNLFGTRWNSPIYTITNGNVRMITMAGGVGANDGRIAIGNNLAGNFQPVNRFHMHQNGAGTYGIQFTNSATSATPFAPTATEGFAMNYVSNGRFDFQQFNNQNVRFIMPGAGIPLSLMELRWNRGPLNLGQVEIRPGPNVFGLFVGGFIYNPAVLNIGGPLSFSQASGANVTNTLMYYNTSFQGTTTHPQLDGFRMQYAFNSDGTPNGDCLVIEKTDGQTAQPDGCIKFTNFGTDAIQRLTMTLEGNGHVGVGRPYTSFITPWRRLSVQDTLTQFRLSFLSTNNASTEIYTDFFTDANGNLLIDPRWTNDDSARVVRINYGTGLVQPYPGLSLDVNGQMNIRTVNQSDSLTYVLVWEPVTGRVYRRDISTIGGTGFAGCGDPAADLQFDSHIDLNNFNYYFEGQGTIGEDQVGVGYDCGDPMLGKLSILVDTIGVSFGVYSQVNATNFNNVGGVFRTWDGTNFNFGVQGNGAGGINGYGGNFGGQGTLSGIGVYGFGSSSAGGTAIGVYGIAGGGTNNYAGYFDGAVVATSFALIPSDQNLKENIVGLSSDSASYYIDALNPSTFNFQTDNYTHMHLSEGHQYGLIAQEVEQVLPSLVTEVTSPAHYDSLGNEVTPSMTFKTLNYEQFIPILIADAQNKNQAIDSLNSVVEIQDSVINDLNTRLTTLENCLSSILPLLCQINNDMIQQNNEETQNQIKSMMNVELKDANNIVLEQNVPNPFAEQTVISYSIPPSVQRAQILFYDENGKLINSVEITERGLGQLNVFASDLSSGIYTYTLVADGVVVSTKKMVKNL